MQFFSSFMSKRKKCNRNKTKEVEDNDIDTKEPEQPDVIMCDPDLELAKTICTKIREEFNTTGNLAVLLRENSPSMALFAEYRKRDSIRGFLDPIVEEACQPMLDDYKENLDIRRSHIGGDDVTKTKTIEQRKKKLMTYVDFILFPILSAKYPTSLRIICQTVGELAAMECNVKQWDTCVGGIVFLRIFSADIACRGCLLAREPPYNQNGNIMRANFTLVSKVLQSIVNRTTEWGKDEAHMEVMAPYIRSQFEPVHRFLNKLCAIPPQDRELVEPPEDPLKPMRKEHRYICNPSQMEEPQLVTALPPSLNINKLCDIPPQDHELVVPPENPLITFYDITDYKSLKSFRDNRRIYDPSQMVQPQLVTPPSSITNK